MTKIEKLISTLCAADRAVEVQELAKAIGVDSKEISSMMYQANTRNGLKITLSVMYSIEIDDNYQDNTRVNVRREIIEIVKEPGDWFTARELEEYIDAARVSIATNLRKLESEGHLKVKMEKNVCYWSINKD